MNIAFLASHNGSAAKAVTEACLGGVLPADAVLLISNNPDSKAIAWAKDLHLKTAVINASNAADPDLAIAGLLEDNAIDLVVCSGYMKLIGPKTIAVVHGGILNVHPALLPKYGGKGMYGRHVHQAVFNAKDSETGITIHLVDGEYDHGKVIAQKKLPVANGESAESIEEKVKAAEPSFYVETISKILSGEISLR
ncbi:MAG: phosphoribosylglycinamide formyltransferase [Micavibrio aeruginosavorus]|uniref:phosphoribosylglycinamide formyltransferase 1 n=1 Tax=Micavibrio aeruginosavorus TaxID=349221 RepID=A0A2W5MZ04_9BACT|nr:MAG: phosphoribosylglycinamide formyltransferase [Micavibrio aeruginosavorus]